MQAEDSGTQGGGLPRAVRVADRLRQFVDFIGSWGAWLSLPVIAVTCLDVIGRKLAYEDGEGLRSEERRVGKESRL